MPFNRFNMISLTAKLQLLITAVILALFAALYFFNMLTVSGGVIAVPILVIFINIAINLLMNDYNKSVKEAKPQLRSAKNPNLPRPTHPVLSTPWLAAYDGAVIKLSLKFHIKTL